MSSDPQRFPRTSVASAYSTTAAASAPHSAALSGNCGGSWCSAHHTTPATATTEIASPTSDSRDSPRRGAAGSSGPFRSGSAGAPSGAGVGVLVGVAKRRVVILVGNRRR